MGGQRLRTWPGSGRRGVWGDMVLGRCLLLAIKVVVGLRLVGASVGLVGL